MSNNVIELFQPVHTLIGQGSIGEIPRFIHKIAGKRALIVTDEGLVKVGTVRKITDVLEQSKIPYSIFEGVLPNPTVGIVNQARSFFEKEHCDYIIAIGGGSPIDVAKAVSILSANGGKIEDYNGVNKSQKPGVPILAVNTTAGTGSEVTRAYVITDEKTKSKMLMVDNHSLAYLAVNDPELMVDMPPSLTAATGMDALSHSIEAYVSQPHTPYTDGLALEAIRLIAENLPRAFKNKNDMEARTNMCWAEYLAGLAFSNAGLGLVHGIAHQLGGFYNMPHGLANAIILPCVMEYNRPHCAKRMADIALALRASAADGMTDDDMAKAAIEQVRKLTAALEIPYLCETKFNLNDVDVLADHALKDTATADNPVPPTAADVKRILVYSYCEGMVMKMLKEKA